MWTIYACKRFGNAMNQMFFEFTIPMNLSPRYNISPTQDVAIIANTPSDTADTSLKQDKWNFFTGDSSRLGRKIRRSETG